MVANVDLTGRVSGENNVIWHCIPKKRHRANDNAVTSQYIQRR